MQLNMPGSDLERRAHLLLAQLEHADLSEAEPEGEEGGVGAGLRGGAPMAEPEGEESGVGAGLGGDPMAAAGLGAETGLRVPAWAPPSGMMFCCGVWGQGFSGRQRRAFCLEEKGMRLGIN